MELKLWKVWPRKCQYLSVLEKTIVSNQVDLFHGSCKFKHVECTLVSFMFLKCQVAMGTGHGRAWREPPPGLWDKGLYRTKARHDSEGGRIFNLVGRLSVLTNLTEPAHPCHFNSFGFTFGSA